MPAAFTFRWNVAGGKIHFSCWPPCEKMHPPALSDKGASPMPRPAHKMLGWSPIASGQRKFPRPPLGPPLLLLLPPPMLSQRLGLTMFWLDGASLEFYKVGRFALIPPPLGPESIFQPFVSPPLVSPASHCRHTGERLRGSVVRQSEPEESRRSRNRHQDFSPVNKLAVQLFI